MTELEKMLKDTLTRMEQDLTATQLSQGHRLNSQQRILESHSKDIRQLADAIGQLQTEQEESARHLQRLSDIHVNLESLLSRLSNLLSGK